MYKGIYNVSITNIYGIIIFKECFGEKYSDETPFKCFNFTCLYVLLKNGFGFTEETPVTVCILRQQFNFTIEVLKLRLLTTV